MRVLGESRRRLLAPALLTRRALTSWFLPYATPFGVFFAIPSQVSFIIIFIILVTSAPSLICLRPLHLLRRRRPEV